MVYQGGAQKLRAAESLSKHNPSVVGSVKSVSWSVRSLRITLIKRPSPRPCRLYGFAPSIACSKSTRTQISCSRRTRTPCRLRNVTSPVPMNASSPRYGPSRDAKTRWRRAGDGVEGGMKHDSSSALLFCVSCVR